MSTVAPLTAEFVAGLACGVQALARTYGSSLTHIVTLSQNRAANRSEPVDGSLEQAAAWTARALCGSYGGRYFWRATPEPGASRCKRCFARWRALKQPLVHGWSQAAPTIPDWPLPFGWRELPPTGHPYDVAPRGDLTAIRNKVGDVVGVHRTELRRFRRGSRIVRLVALTAARAGELSHCVLCHDERAPLDERDYHAGGLRSSTQALWTLMAKGGIR